MNTSSKAKSGCDHAKDGQLPDHWKMSVKRDPVTGQFNAAGFMPCQ
jgi:hypothetical protein